MNVGVSTTAAHQTVRRAAVLGSPIKHSLSPVLHRAAYQALDLHGWHYDKIECDEPDLPRLLDSMGPEWAGLSLTMPLKRVALTVADEVSPLALAVGAANTLVFEAGAVFAENSDGDGLLDDLREGARFDPAGRRCGVIGAGGAGRAAVLALAEAGAEQIIIVNRTVTPAWRSAALAPKVARVGRPAELSGRDLVVQATPVAMAGRDASGGDSPGAAPGGSGSEFVAGVDPSKFGSGQLVVDLVYDPPLTPFLLEARRQGATVRNGLGMLVHQAAHQIRLWTGAEPPLSVMWSVVGGDTSRAG